jgi:excisionase family DNA binding protein
MPDSNGTREDELLTVEEIANELKLHPQTIRTWIRTGRLPAKKYGRVYRLRRTDVDAVLNADEGEGSIGANRDLFIPETLSVPYQPRGERPSVWEANTPRPGIE